MPEKSMPENLSQEAASMQTQSHVQGATDVPLIDETSGVYFDRIARRHADNDALVVVHQQVRWT